MLFYKVRQLETVLSLEKFKGLGKVTLPYFRKQELGPYWSVPI
jgi:hypothetical protein